MSRADTQKTLTFHDGSDMTLRLSVDILAIADHEREFMFEIIDRFRDFEKDEAKKGAAGGTE